jgi:regulator of sigma E protease
MTDQSPSILFMMFSFLLAMGPLIFLHELGHYWVGRWCGIKADAFSIGFGREIAGWTDKNGTRWKLSWIPLGGYVKFKGDMSPAGGEDPKWKTLSPEEQEGVFHNQALWKRAVTVFAGPFTNFIVAIIIMGGFAWVYGENVSPAVVHEIEQGGVAERAGIKVGDKIIDVNGTKVRFFDQVRAVIQDRPGEEISITVERSGEKQTLTVIPKTITETDRFGNIFRLGRLGIMQDPKQTFRPVEWYRIPSVAVERTIVSLNRMMTNIWQLVTGRRPLSELGGPIKIAKISGEVASMGWPNFIHLVAMISINLGFMNLLPIPMLDGGHLAFYAAEAVRGKPANPQMLEYAFRSGLIALLAFMIFVTYNDLSSLGVFGRFGG